MQLLLVEIIRVWKFVNQIGCHDTKSYYTRMFQNTINKFYNIHERDIFSACCEIIFVLWV